MLMFVFSGIIPFYFVSGFAGDDKYLEKIKYALIVSASLASSYAILQFFNLDFIWPRTIDPYGQRSISTFGNPNFLSAFLLIVVIWTCGYVMSRKTKIWILILFINIAGLGITMTRSTIASLIFGVVGVGYMGFKISSIKTGKIKKYTAAIIGGILIIIFLFTAASPQFSKRIKGFVSVKNMGPALYQRLLIWESSSNMFKETPIIGRGWGNFEIFYPFYQGEIAQKQAYMRLRTHANNAHNLLFELLTQVGILGAGIYLWLIATFIYFSNKLFKKVTREKKIWVIVFSIAGLAFWIDNILNVSLFFPMPALAFWVNAGMLSSLARKEYAYPEFKIKNIKILKTAVILALIIGSGAVYFNTIYFISSIHFFKGFKLSRQGKFRQAKKELLASHEIYSLNVDNNYELGNVYARLVKENKDNLEKSIWAYNQAIQANPGYDEIYYNLGMMYLKKDDLDQALKNMRISERINPINPDTLRTLGDIMAKKKEYSKATNYYKKAISMAQEFNQSEDTIKWMWNNLGYYTEIEKKFKSAAEAYIKALEIDPDMNSAKNNLFRVMKKIDRKSEVQNIKGLFNQAENYIKSKKWSEAISKIKQILEIDPVNFKAMLYKANIYFKMGKLNKAEKSYKLILALDPDNKTASRNLEILNQTKR